MPHFADSIKKLQAQRTALADEHHFTQSLRYINPAEVAAAKHRREEDGKSRV